VGGVLSELKRDHAQQREGLVLTKRPIATVKLFSLSVLQQLRRLSAYVIVHQHMVSAFCVFLLINITTLAILDGPHEKVSIYHPPLSVSKEIEHLSLTIMYREEWS